MERGNNSTVIIAVKTPTLLNLEMKINAEDEGEGYQDSEGKVKLL